jgi:hypothetical protein
MSVPGRWLSCSAGVCVRVHVSAHGCTAANSCTRCGATTEERRLGTAEDDRDSARRGGDTVLRTKDHGHERGLPGNGSVTCTRVHLAERQGPDRHDSGVDKVGRRRNMLARAHRVCALGCAGQELGVGRGTCECRACLESQRYLATAACAGSRLGRWLKQ